jgi:hypothetical protein
MKLKEFVETFVRPNSLIRLWFPTKGGHQMIYNDYDSVCMNWELVKGETWQSKFNDYEVIGVKDIVVKDAYSEAINIVIKIKED